MGAPDSDRLHWWQTRGFVVFVFIACMIPLIRPEIPPLVDLPGHMGRYRVQQSWGDYSWFEHWYEFKWALIGNLGVDLLVVPLEPLLGLEWAVKLIVMAIPPLTAVGLLWIAREVHGRIPATALFALPLAYSYPFHFGFVNFALAMALALNAFALWLRLARQGRFRLRSILFVPIGCIIWVCHTYGWGTLGVLAFSAELIRRHDKSQAEHGFVKAWVLPWFHAGIQCLVLCPPALLMLAWRSGHVSGATSGWFAWRAKMAWITMILRDRWQMFDIASLGVLYLILFKGVRDPNIEYSRNLGASALFLALVYVFLPRTVFGSAYADMRLAPYLFAIALIALRPRPGLSIRGASALALMGLAFFGVRTAGTTASFWMYAHSYERELKALEHVPVGARLVTFVGEDCYNRWPTSRLEHLPGIALERRLAYANDQWSMAGGQLLTVHYGEAGRYAHDPSEIVVATGCVRAWWRPLPVALTEFPRDAFDYVWLIQPPEYDRALEQGLTPVWRDGDSALFKVKHGAAPAVLTLDNLGPDGPILIERLKRREEARARLEALGFVVPD